MTKKKQGLLIAIIITTIICFGIFCAFLGARLNEKNAELLNLEYGDSFASITVINSEGKEIKALGTNDRYSVVVYLSKDCGSCVDSIATYEMIYNILNESGINFYIIWENKIPLNLLKKHNVPIEINFSLQGKYSLASSVPAAYILDNKSSVIFKEFDLVTMFEKFFELSIVTSENLIKSANKYILDTFSTFDNDKELLIYFSMIGCPDCEQADQVIKDDQLQDKFNILTIYRHGTDNKSLTIDHYKLLANIYNIEWYPSFLLLKSQDKYSFVGEIPIETLWDTLINL